MTHHPDDLASVTADNRDRLMGVADAILTITNSERHMIAATVDELAQIIRRVDGKHSLGAGELAEAILANLPQRAVSDELADLEAKARAATQGEWNVLTSRLDSTRSIMAGDPAFFLARCHKSPVSDATANAAYIVAAQPSVVLELIERIRAAEAKAGEPVAWRWPEPNMGGFYVVVGHQPLENLDEWQPLYAAPVDTAALAKRVKTLEEALEWYAEQARLCRLIHSEGDAGRHELSADGGKRARAALGGSNE